ncbi:MAG: type II toxin-antitoxin system VapC family toxin [Candidatus Odinarchaeota archaeon]|nr:type II toxin-antitoxin system VapC family toxin [Candidatus Odinarchaeota archaeon]
MSIFVDTNIFVALRNEDDIHHKRAKELMRKMLLGEFGTIYTSNFVFDEAVTVALVRTKNIELAEDIGRYILSTNRIKFVFIDETLFNDAWMLFKKLSKKRLSFTDCTNIAVIRSRSISWIASFDAHFDGLVNRIF